MDPVIEKEVRYWLLENIHAPLKTIPQKCDGLDCPDAPSYVGTLAKSEELVCLCPHHYTKFARLGLLKTDSAGMLKGVRAIVTTEE